MNFTRVCWYSLFFCICLVLEFLTYAEYAADSLAFERIEDFGYKNNKRSIYGLLNLNWVTLFIAEAC